MALPRHAYLKNRLFSVSMEWHSRLLLLTSAVFTTLVQWIGALQKNTPSPLGRACSRQEVRCKGTAKESPGMMAGRTTGSATETHVSTETCLPPQSPAQGTGGRARTHCLELTGCPISVPLASPVCSSQWGLIGPWSPSEHCLPWSLQRRPGRVGVKRTMEKREIEKKKKVWLLKIMQSIITLVRRPT